MSETKSFTLGKEHELRIEVGWKVKVQIKLIKGTAEIFGCEIAVDQALTITGTKLAVFSWHGAEIQVTGSTDHAYVADETPMVSYVNTHSVLERRRLAAQQAGPSGQGPVTMLVGPTDVGKSSLFKLLSNYAVRHGWNPVLVDLDVGQSMFTLPGTVAAAPLERPVDPAEGLPLDAPLVFYYGHTTPSENAEHYKHEVERLGAALDQHRASGAGAQHGGVFVNTMGFIEGLGYELLLHAAAVLRADVILVLGQDRLHSELDRHFHSDPQVSVVKLPKSGGVVTRANDYRKQARSTRIQEYFYGVKDDLCVTHRTVPFSELAVFRIGGAFRAPSSALPMGSNSVADPMKVNPVPWSPELVNTILAVSHAQTPEELPSANVAGFVWVTAVDMRLGQVTYNAPCAGPLPSCNLLAGDLKHYV